MTSSRAYVVLLTGIALERAFELWLSNQNARRLFSLGATEVAKDPYPAMVAMHALFLPACLAEVVWLERPFPGALGYAALVGCALAQALRYWAVHTLGSRWCTRLIVLPRALPITQGPYRWVRHPNYLAVILELICLPCIHGAYLTALVFTLANAAILSRRIRLEELALGGVYARAFADRPRFLPVTPSE